MDKVKEFNRIFLEFTSELKSTFPDLKQDIENAERRVQEKNTTRYYLDYYLKHILPHMEDVAKCDETACANVSVVHGVRLKKLMKDQSDANKGVIWKYLHTMFIIGYNAMNDVLDKNKEHGQYEDMKRNLENHGEILKTILENTTKSEGGEPFSDETMKSLGGFFENSAIGNIAKELSEEINPEDLKGIDDPMSLFSSMLNGKMDGNLGNLIQKVSEKVGGKLNDKMQKGELKEDQLMSEVQGMMGMLGGMPGMGKSGGKMPFMSPEFMQQMMGSMGGGSGKKKSYKKGVSKKKKRVLRNKTPRPESTVSEQPPQPDVD